MHSPDDLLRRAADLSDKAEVEATLEIRERLRNMAALYRHLAESEQEMADNPISITSVGNFFQSKNSESQRRRTKFADGIFTENSLYHVHVTRVLSDERATDLRHEIGRWSDFQLAADVPTQQHFDRTTAGQVSLNSSVSTSVAGAVECNITPNLPTTIDGS